MKTYISILRGINLGGHKSIKMDALRQLYEALGLENPKTYIQSGNVVFQSPLTETKALADEIKKAILERFGFAVPVLVKSLEELKEIVRLNPFASDDTKEKAFLHVTFLSDKPAKEALAKLAEGSYQADEFQLIDQAIYLYCPNGYGNSKLSNTFLENKLKVIATTRNWKTTNELIRIAEAL